MTREPFAPNGTERVPPVSRSVLMPGCDSPRIAPGKAPLASAGPGCARGAQTPGMAAGRSEGSSLAVVSGQTPAGGARGRVPSAGSQALAARMSEATLERHVQKILRDLSDLAPVGDVLGYHTHFSKASTAGFPDWVFAGPGGVLFRELKTARGRLSLAQVVWRRTLRKAGADVDVWRPEDLLSGRVARELAALAGIGGQP